MSATEAYQRDNFLHWLVYHPLHGGQLGCAPRLRQAQGWDLFAGCTAGMYGSVAMYLYLRTINAVAAARRVAPFVVVSPR